VELYGILTHGYLPGLEQYKDFLTPEWLGSKYKSDLLCAYQIKKAVKNAKN